MAGKVRNYEGQDIDVQYDVKRCIHARECVNRLSAVFDVDKRPWIQPDNTPSTDALAETIQHCPTGALHFMRKDGGAQEQTPEDNTIRIVADGPLYVRGDVQIVNASGELVIEDVRVALCRCGASNKSRSVIIRTKTFTLRMMARPTNIRTPTQTQRAKVNCMSKPPKTVRCW